MNLRYTFQWVENGLPQVFPDLLDDENEATMTACILLPEGVSFSLIPVNLDNCAQA